jgi:hypothetical protein
MLKRIPKSDISIRPFKAYKKWSFDESSSEITLLEANSNSSELSNGYPKNSIYGQLRAQFYNGNEDNPFLRFGDKSSDYNDEPSTRDRFLSGSAKVISIPQIYVGEGIKKGSVILIDNDGTSTSYIDDTHGNLIGGQSGDIITFGQIDVENSIINFTDSAFNTYSASIQGETGSFDINTGTFNIIYNSISHSLTIINFNIQTGIMVVDDLPFLPEEAQNIKIGNVFYTQGIIVLTRNAASLLNADWNLNFKSTKTIYEHEYLLIVNEDEFNVSQNPSAVVTEGGEYESFIDSSGNTHRVYSKQPVKYIRKKSILENGNELDYRYTSSVSSSTHFAGFEHYDLSSSIDSTGSFLTPFITTIGLYDDNCDLVAVAKLPQPIKSEKDIPVNFIIRFDT